MFNIFKQDVVTLWKIIVSVNIRSQPPDSSSHTYIHIYNCRHNTVLYRSLIWWERWCIYRRIMRRRWGTSVCIIYYYNAYTECLLRTQPLCLEGASPLRMCTIPDLRNLHIMSRCSRSFYVSQLPSFYVIMTCRLRRFRHVTFEMPRIRRTLIISL